MPIEAEVIYDYKLYRDFSRFNMFKGKWNRAGLPFFAVIVLIASIFTIIDIVSEKNSDYLFLSVIILILVIFMTFLYFFLPKISFNSNKLVSQTKNTFLFNETTISITTEKEGTNGQSTIDYSNINKVYETKLYFFVYIGMGQAYVIPKSSINGGKAEDLKEFLIKVLTPKKFIRCI